MPVLKVPARHLCELAGLLVDQESTELNAGYTDEVESWAPKRHWANRRGDGIV
jgi:hypothetical protein